MRAAARDVLEDDAELAGQAARRGRGEGRPGRAGDARAGRRPGGAGRGRDEVARRVIPAGGGAASAACGSAGAAGSAGAGPAPVARPLPAPAASGSSTTRAPRRRRCRPRRRRAASRRRWPGTGCTTIALSVCTSTRSWCSRTWSPTATCHATTSAIAMPSPTSGSRNSTGATSGLQRRPDAGQHALDRRDVERPRPIPAGTACRARPRVRSARRSDQNASSWIVATSSAPKPALSGASWTTSARPRARDRLAQCVDVERHEAAQVEHPDRQPLGGGALGRLLGDDHRGAVGHDDQVVALAHHPRLTRAATV